jgi:hypothetical protein
LSTPSLLFHDLLSPIISCLPALALFEALTNICFFGSYVNFVDVHKQPRKAFKVMGYCPQVLPPGSMFRYLCPLTVRSSTRSGQM